MITCRELVELLCDFIEGGLSAEERQRIEAHLCDCPPCVIYVETYRMTIKLSRKLPSAALPPHLAERLRQVVEEKHRQQGNLGQEGE